MDRQGLMAQATSACGSNRSYEQCNWDSGARHFHEPCIDITIGVGAIIIIDSLIFDCFSKRHDQR